LLIPTIEVRISVPDTKARTAMSVTDELLEANERYAADFDQGDLPMDARLDVYRPSSGSNWARPT
jgi:hypothetical protein